MKKSLVYAILASIVILAFLLFTISNDSSTPSNDKQVLVSVKQNTTTLNADTSNLIKEDPKFAEDRFDGIRITEIEVFDNESSDYVIISFEDKTGYLNKKCFNSVEYQGMKRVELCEVCSEEATGRLWCNIHNYTGHMTFNTFSARTGEHYKIIDKVDTLSKTINQYYLDKYGNQS